MRSLLIDMSPIFYGSLFSVTSSLERSGVKPIELPEYDCPKFEFNYEDMLVFKIFEEISDMKTKFQVDEVLLAFDNSSGGYWRKDYWSGYKYGRAKSRDESTIMWDKAFKVFEKIKILLEEHSSFKILNVPRTEGDDHAFVLSNHLSNLGHKVIIHSLDHDLMYCLKNPGVSYYRTRKTQKKDGHYVEPTPAEILDMELDHLIGGDGGDYIKNVKAYSVFSEEFKEKYPNMTELQVWPKRHEIDISFEDKFGVSAYKHPRYGYKMFLKTKLTIDELLEQNPIYELNYNLNKQIAMPEGIPQDIRTSIIESYNTAKTTKNNKELQNYFKSLGLFELVSKIPFL